jgi:2-C-methyl-D-erythritol 4-phosphate cytidylyltransferase
MAVALVVAAGSGERLGAGTPKAAVPVAGRTLLQWSLDAIAAVAEVHHVVVALAPGMHAPPGVLGVPGGPVRSESVRLALAASPAGDPVLVHDAARPLITPALAEAVIAALQADSSADAAIAAAPLRDTVKRVGAGTRAVSETLPRSELWAVQTPQVFRRAALEHALSAGEEVLAQATDDAWLVERAGGRVIVVPAGEENVKVTTPIDLKLAELLLRERG